MKRFASKKILAVAVFTVLSLTFSLVVNQSSTVYASKEADTKADQACSDISGTSETANRTREACKKGFVAGYDGGDKAKTCKGTTKSTCEKAFDEGKEAKTKAPETDGREGAKAKKSKTDTCKKYKNAANKNTCEKAYDNQNKAMAEIAGKAAGKGGEDSPCGSLGYGGQAAKEACEKGYAKGKNEAGKSARSSCGGVDTYFDYGAACEGTNKKAGGNQSPILALALTVVGWVTGLVAVAVVGGVVYGGFLYLTARDNSGQTQKGVTVITNSVVALIAWIFAYALINFIVPGGLFRG